MSGIRRLIDTLFPSGDSRRGTTELIERGLEALRRERDARAIVMGKLRTVPSRLELRLPQALYDDLLGVGGVRDVEFFLNDELMKDLRVDGLKTFGDHPVYVTVQLDTSLPANEIYATVLVPQEPVVQQTAGAQPPHDRTVILGVDDEVLRRGTPSPAAAVAHYRLVVRNQGALIADVLLEGRHWIVGRSGSSGRPLPPGCTKVDVDFPAAVSREQLRIDLIDADRLRLQRIGQGATALSQTDRVAADENRLVSVGVPFYVEGYELIVGRY